MTGQWPVAYRPPGVPSCRRFLDQPHLVTRSSSHTVKLSQVNSSHTHLVTQSTGNRTLQTQDTSVPRHFGTSAEVSRRHFGTGAEASGQFGPKTLRHQDVSALVSGHFGTIAWTLGTTAELQNAAETVRPSRTLKVIAIT